ncbi:hypothetical protein L226DRAFT_528480 [Lentinus tigrinus ALCF2SS1-7]|uniref:uncharacterized protein n=1 Tax=Lentinus tigrinus ALCF2SS1-7 TaxID=1328758 RepID=UPI0011660E3C|nr:hypothetical protein L226DRAFT_528480 [Lentinus tigrinus ALCF2SS1-7]
MANTRETFTKVLEDGSGMTGAFSWSLKCSNAPNPGLCVDGLGSIGLPLGSRDAEALKAIATLPGQDEYSWDVRAENVHFENTTWSAFMTDTLRKVCDGLGVCEEAHKPRWELVGMSLCSTGSSASISTGTGNLIATLVIVLPCKFTGGAIRVEHGDRVETYDCTPGAITDTTMVAWHRDTTHEMLPVTGGYQLALHYGVFSTIEHPVLSLATQDEVLARLSQVLSSWNQAARDGTVPSKIVYLLKNKYSQDKLSASLLTGADAHTLSLVDTVAKRHGSRLGLATLVFTESGICLLGHRHYSDDNDWQSEKENIEGFDDLGDIDTDIKLQRLVDLDGHPVHDSLEFDLEKEAIPLDLETAMKSGEPDKRLIGFVDFDDLQLRQVYYRTALVVLPHWSDLWSAGLDVHDAEPPAKRRRTEG